MLMLQSDFLSLISESSVIKGVARVGLLLRCLNQRTLVRRRIVAALKRYII